MYAGGLYWRKNDTYEKEVYSRTFALVREHASFL